MKPCAAHLIAALACLLAFAAQPAQAAQEKDEPGVVRINALKNPELRSYRAVVKGTERFEARHALAPKVPQLLFQVRAMRGGPVEGTAPKVTLSADGFSVPLQLDEEARFAVPRSEQAWNAKAELVLNRRQRAAQIVPYVRTPGLADTQRRLGDLRLTCQVQTAIAKEELGVFWSLSLDALVRSTDWCSHFTGEKKRNWAVEADAMLAGASLHEGGRSLPLTVKNHSFTVPIADTSWGDDAIVELEYAAPQEPTTTNTP